MHGCIHVHTDADPHPQEPCRGSRGTGTWAVLRTPGPTFLLCDPSRLHGFSGLGSSGVRSGGRQAPGGGMPSAKHSAAPVGPWGRAAPLEWKGRAGVQAGAALSWDSGRQASSLTLSAPPHRPASPGLHLPFARSHLVSAGGLGADGGRPSPPQHQVARDCCLLRLHVNFRMDFSISAKNIMGTLTGTAVKLKTTLGPSPVHKHGTFLLSSFISFHTPCRFRCANLVGPRRR